MHSNLVVDHKRETMIGIPNYNLSKRIVRCGTKSHGGKRDPLSSYNHSGMIRLLKKLTDVTYRIKKGKRGKPKVVHSDKLKLFKGELPGDWALSGTEEPEALELGREELSSDLGDSQFFQLENDVSVPDAWVFEREEGLQPKRAP